MDNGTLIRINDEVVYVRNGQLIRDYGGTSRDAADIVVLLPAEVVR